jgi:hydrogenase-4 component B
VSDPGVWAVSLLAAAGAAFAAGALAAVVLAARPPSWAWASHVLAAAGGLATAAAGALGLAGAAVRARVSWLLPPPGAEVLLDGLGGFFLVLIGGLAVPVSVYAIGYTGGRRRGLAALGAAYNAFLAAMVLVVLAANVLTFLIAWELMALASYLLVMTDTEARGTVQAGWVYALVTHAGLGCLAGGMLLFAGATGSDRFADWPAAAAAVPPVTRGLVFVLLALGFGSKAGLVPLHVWLPLAHPAAPSHVSALMSGVMIKLGVYGLLRTSFEWLGPGPAWWGVVLLLAAGASALLGVLYALVEHDLKRLLAYHSVENVGIILLGLGAGMIFRAAGLEALAVLGVVAALYHTVNHAVFKGLLFLGAGAVLHATGTRNMEAMGGLIKRMPWTAASFLVGAAAISALPPLNGFASEWLVFQTLLQSAEVRHPGLNLVFLLALASLALTGGLAAACFVKAFGISFLALPRSDAAARAHEVGRSLRAGMVVLAVAAVSLGLAAPWVVPVLARAVPGLAAAPPALADGWALSVGGGFASVSPLAVFVLLAVALALVALGLALGRARADGRRYETWGCGRSLQTSRMEYTATAFSQPFKRVFSALYRPVKQLEIEFHPESRFFVRTIRYEQPTRSLIEEWLYLPLLQWTRRAARMAERIQSGSTNLYLAYIFGALLLLLLGVLR